MKAVVRLPEQTSQWVHVLCDDCYAGMVDIGEAHPDPHRIDEEYRWDDKCCGCGEAGFWSLFLQARPHRFPNCGDGPRSIASGVEAEHNAGIDRP